MKKTIRALLAAMILVAGIACVLSAESLPLAGGVQANIVTGTASVSFNPQYSGMTSAQITGTWFGVLVPQVTVDGSNWVNAKAYNVDGASAGSFTSNGIYRIDTAGAASVRVSATAYTGGSAVVTLRNSPASIAAEEIGAGTFKPVQAVATLGVLWLPTSSKKFRLMGFDLVGSAAGTITLFDGAVTIVAHSTAAAGTSVPVYLGTRGYLSAAGGTSLTASSSGGGTMTGAVWGTEE